MAQAEMDPVVRGEDAATMRHVEGRFNRFPNKLTWWRHAQNGTLAEFDRRFDEEVASLRANLGRRHPLVIDGKEISLDTTFTTRSPADSRLVVGHFASGTRDHAKQAIAASRKGFPAWSATPWQERVAILEKAADIYAEHFYELCAIMCIEAGKTRYEASIDVDEATDFLRFYALTMREMNGFEMVMGKPVPSEACFSVRRPWGVFSVICPFNFPVAITTGMAAAALVAGNTAILKPSAKGCLSGWRCYQLLREAGVPASVLQFLTAGDHSVSTELLENPDVDGIVFTGSKKVGFGILRTSAEIGKTRPVIAEMGGKNAIVVSDKADLDKAVQGVFRSAFGFSGQKCSACSRVYVHEKVADEFTDRLVKLTQAAKVAEPWRKEAFLGPVIERGKLDLLKDLTAQAKRDGGAVIAGGSALGQDADGNDLHGNYMAPTIVAGLPLGHRVFREEFFMPFLALGEVPSFQAGIEEANKAEYGLTAGCFTEDAAEQKAFLERIHAGVLYVNRAAGGSTAAVVNAQSFVGWKNSGTTGHGAGGRYYLLQFTREQSHTVVS